MRSGEGLSVYCHVPFCRRKCPYCGFYSEESLDRESISRFQEGALLELRLWRELVGADLPVISIYFGGGTPSLLSPPWFERFIEATASLFTVAVGCEISVEANPDSFSREWLQAIMECGVNRVSIGVQSLDPKGLEALGRLHTLERARSSMLAAKETGIPSVGGDLICGWPGQNLQGWLEELREMAALGVDHLSCYALSLEAGTRLAELVARGELHPCDDDTVAEMLQEGGRMLRSLGFSHYEISNFARPGHQCLHNLHYWRQGRYIGIGPAAASFMGWTRYKNPPSLRRWLQALEEGLLAADVECRLTEEEAFREWVVLGLRTGSGISLQEAEKRWGRDPLDYYGHGLDPFFEKDLLRSEGDRLYLSEEGMLLSNRLFVELI